MNDETKKVEETEKQESVKDRIRTWWTNGGNKKVIGTAVVVGLTALTVVAGKKFLNYGVVVYKEDLNKLLKNPLPDVGKLEIKEVENAVRKERNLEELTGVIKGAIATVTAECTKHGVDDVGIMYFGKEGEPAIDYIIDGMSFEDTF